LVFFSWGEGAGGGGGQGDLEEERERGEGELHVGGFEGFEKSDRGW